MVTTRLLKAEDLAELAPDQNRYELMRGELRVMSPAGGEHAEIGTEFVYHLRAHIGPDGGRVYTPDAGFILARDPDTVLSPDGAYIQADRLPPPSERRGFLTVVPDLVIEIVSPTDRPREIVEKVAIYLAVGVRAVWVADPRSKTITRYAQDREPSVLSLHDTLDGGDILPDFCLPPTAFFRE